MNLHLANSKHLAQLISLILHKLDLFSEVKMKGTPPQSQINLQNNAGHIQHTNLAKM